MSLPPYFPDQQRSEKMIQDLLTRVRKLDSTAKKRLSTLLDEEADLPMLDKLERSYRKKVQATLAKIADQNSAQELSNALRSHFNRNLTLQRDYLHGQVRKVLHDSITNEEQSMHPIADSE